MPTFEFTCDDCNVEFDELFILQNEISQFSHFFPCPTCGKDARRAGVSLINFSFKAPAGQTQGSGVHGQSGVHDLDYPKVDQAVGRSADKKWEHLNDRKKKRDKVRREVGANPVTQVGNTVVRASEGTLQTREQALTTFSKTKTVK